MSDCVLLFSGGLDSTTLLWHLLNKGKTPLCVSFFYGQRHSCEIRSGKAIVELAKVGRRVVNLSSLFSHSGTDVLTNKGTEVPKGHYEDASMKVTYVPNRNMIMLAAAAGIAISGGLDEIYYAAHAGDHAIYPDCREDFIQAMGGSLKLCNYTPINLITPFVYWRKEQVCARGLELGAPLHLTWSCYVGGDKHCGECGTCSERKEAYALCGGDDPTEYAI